MHASRWLGRRELTGAATALLLISCLQGAVALTAISDWIPGFATFYGGQPDGLSPYSPSNGTSVVRPSPISTYPLRANVYDHINCDLMEKWV